MTSSVYKKVIEQHETTMSKLFSKAQNMRVLKKDVANHPEIWPELYGVGIDMEHVHVSYSASSWLYNKDGGTMRLEAPWDKELADQILTEFTKLGWEIDRETDNKKDWAEYDFYLKHKKSCWSVHFEMDAQLSGSKCKVVKIGEVKSSRAQYAIECDEQQEI